MLSKKKFALTLLTLLLAACNNPTASQADKTMSIENQSDTYEEATDDASDADLNIESGVQAAKKTVNKKKMPSHRNLWHNPDSFVEGNLYFLGYHEIGHALVSEFNLPVIGREEDGVDRLATLLMTPEDNEEPPEYLSAAISGWFMSSTETPLSEIAWWDEHGTDQQRAYQIACLLYGSNPKRHQNIAKEAGLPTDREEYCKQDAHNNELSWDKLLDSHTLDEDEDSTKAVTVVYEPSKDYADQITYLKDIGLLEDLADFLNSNFRLKPGIKVIGKSCDEANAFWDGDERELQICYELVEDYRALAAK